MERDLTVGKPITAILKYTLPLFGSIIFQQLYNIADSLVAGRYIGTDALAAVGNGYEITLLFIAVAFGCNIGTSVITARYFGKKDIRGVKTTVSTALIVSTVIAVILTALGLGLTKPLLNLIKTDPVIFTDSYEYLMIYLGGYIFLLSYNIATGIFSALGDSLTPFLFLAVSSVANVIVDIVFVKTLHMGVKGVAWATFICQGVSAILALAFMFVRLRKLPHEGDEKIKKVDFKILKEISVVAIPSILQQAFISVGNIIIQGFINAFGAWATGGYAAAIKLNNMAVTSVVALGNGMSNFSAQNMGAGKPERIKKGIFGAIGMGAVISLIFTAIFLGLSEPCIKIFITDGNADAIGTGVNFLKIVTPFYVIIAVKIIADGTLRGTNRMLSFTIATFIDLLLRVMFSAILKKPMGITGIWWSWPIGWLIATPISFGLYLFAAKKNFGLKKENAPAEIESSGTPSETEEKAEEKAEEIVSENAAESVAPEDNNLTE